MSQPFSQKLVAALPFVLPVFGGLGGVACINMLNRGNPLLGIAAGVLAGWALSVVLVRLLDR